MTSYHYEMKVPIRPAPPPPVSQNSSQYSSRPTSSWNGSSRDNHSKPGTSIPKKKPPPRPPPPKFNNLKLDKRQVPTRPSQLITSLFQRKNHSTSKIADNKLSRPNTELSDPKCNNTVTCLIDFNSPPSSPTFTTRSSSDALSVNSFGSDGVTPCSTSSGNTSNVESGFEDDFDFFGGLSNSKKNENTQIRDPWSPPPKHSEKKGAWVTFSSPGSSKRLTQNVSAMPTIIRVKPERPKPPAVPKPDARVTSNIDVVSDIFQSAHLSSNPNYDYDDDDDDDNEWSSLESPPMPTCPPPAPPPEVLNGLHGKEKFLVEDKRPHAVALYDYESYQPGDLSFKEKDIVYLVRRVDENWFMGEREGRQGSVPVNFLRILVPLLEEDRCVRAIYPFTPETWDDLELREGDVVRVIAKIDHDWLYGECSGKAGQFPANFVDRIPQDLPTKAVSS